MAGHARQHVVVADAQRGKQQHDPGHDNDGRGEHRDQRPQAARSGSRVPDQGEDDEALAGERAVARP